MPIPATMHSPQLTQSAEAKSFGSERDQDTSKTFLAGHAVDRVAQAKEIDRALGEALDLMTDYVTELRRTAKKACGCCAGKVVGGQVLSNQAAEEDGVRKQARLDQTRFRHSPERGDEAFCTFSEDVQGLLVRIEHLSPLLDPLNK